MQTLRRIALTFWVLSICIFCVPVLGFAADSANYQNEDIVNYGGNYSSSENYQVIDNFGNSDVFYTQKSGGGTPTPAPTPTLQPTAKPVPSPITSPEIEIAGPVTIIDRIFDIFKAIADNPIIKALEVPIAAVVAAIALWSALVPLIMNLPMASPFASIAAWFLALFQKKRNPWGRVYDSETRVGIPLAAVRLFDKEFNRLLKTELTDNEGRYGFIVQPGNYYIQVVKTDFSFPSKTISRDYHGATIAVKGNEPILADIPLDSNKKVLAERLNVFAKITDFFSAIRIPLLIFGTILSIFFIVAYHRTIDIVILVMYVCLWIWEIYVLINKSKAFGNVNDFISRSPINLAIVRVFNNTNKKLVSTKVSDAKGRFRFLIGKGNYYITSLKPGYLQYESKNIPVAKQKVITENILLNPKTVAKQIPVTEMHNEKVPSLLDLAQKTNS
jgi:hypothetical protein